MYLNAEVRLYKKDVVNNTWSDSYSTITDAREMRVTRGMGKTKSSWECRIRNPNNLHFDSTDGFAPDDRIRIFMFANKASPTDDDMVMDGVITEPGEKIGEQDIVIRGASMAETLLRTAVWVPKDTGGKIDELIRGVIIETNRMNRLNSADEPRYIVGGEDSQWGPECGNPTTKHNGEDFPTTDYARKYTNAFELIDELSQDKMTGDGEYYFYFDFDPDYVCPLGGTGAWLFKWRRKGGGTVEAIATITEGTDETTLDISKSVEDVVNHMIVFAGYDPFGSVIEFPLENTVTTGKIGKSTIYWTKTQDIGSNIVANEINLDVNKAYFEYDSEGNVVNKYPKDAAYPYTCKGIYARDTLKNWAYTTDPPTLKIVADKYKFRDAVRDEAKGQAAAICLSIMEKYSNPRYKAKITIPRGTTQYLLGSIYKLTCPSFNLNEKPLRLMEITYNFWDIDLNFEEDAETATT